jgi:natural product biosynthesis luciferase-like monooxygenase protein
VDADALSRDSVQPCEAGGREVVSCGPPAPEVNVRIVHPASGEDCGGAVGEITIDGPSVASGYHDSPTEAARTFTPRGLRTGDLGFLHDGELYVVGRRKEMLIVRGRNYYPHDLEAAVSAAVPALGHSHVVAGTFDEDGDGLPVIVVEPATRKDNHARTVLEIQAAIRQAFSISIDAAVVPKGSVYRTSSGKLERRRTLKALRDGVFEAHAASLMLEGALRARESIATEPLVSLAPPASDGVEPILQLLRAQLATLLRVRPHDIAPEQALGETGLDSLAAAELQSHVYELYEVQLDIALIARASLREVAQRVVETRGEIEALRLSAGPPAQPSEHPVVQLGLDALARPSLFFFRSTLSPEGPLYAALERAVRFADEAGFEAVWLPERHFHGFGAPFPNPAVLAAALAVQTTQISLRAGSVVMPVNHPLRVVEEWSMVDRLSGGRVGLSFTSGDNARDFVLSPGDFKQRREKTSEGIATVRKLWRGESLPYVDGHGETVSISSFPEPIQRELPIWLTCAERSERFAEAGRAGFNVLTAPFFEDMSHLGEHIQIYRDARAAAGLDRGHVTVAVHAYVGETSDSARAEAREPLRAYLASSERLWNPRAASAAALTASEESALLDAAIERYMAGCLVGTEDECASRLRALTELGADEIACLTDFGVATDQAYAGLRRLASLWGL